MDVNELKNKIIKEGIEGCKKDFNGVERDASIQGFEMCRNLKTMKDFEREIERRRKKEIEMVYENLKGEMYEKISDEEYWKHRYATIQIEYTYEILKVAYGYPIISARAGLRYADLLRTESVRE